MDRAAIVDHLGGIELIEFENHDLAVQNSYIAVSGEATKPIVHRRVRRRVVDVDEIIGREIWIESDTEQPPFSGCIYVNRREGSREQRAVLNHPHLAALKRDKQPAVGSELH